MFRIWKRPSSFGRLISICTSSRPGRISASSIMSLRFVMPGKPGLCRWQWLAGNHDFLPMTKILLSCSTPSIFARSWFTTVSWTPVLPATEPRCLQMASISSNMMMCNPLFGPACKKNKLKMMDSDLCLIFKALVCAYAMQAFFFKMCNFLV